MSSQIGNLIRNLFRRPFTRRYPFVPHAVPEGTRGQLAFDASTCIYCGLCVRRCPCDAIVVDRGAKSWQLDPMRCIVCGYCVEACPKDSLAMKPEHRGPTVR